VSVSQRTVAASAAGVFFKTGLWITAAED